ncbi:TPA: hypothetical protein ACS7XC_003371 [Providencia alcalifaciens]|uniref:Uncharacterized protein n=1 Tax=Providencia alcalifaciens TaxID=126385 RepID=A0AAW9VEG2_9GAMM|nr:hypothetical protein [Providencia alcalifaciens]
MDSALLFLKDNAVAVGIVLTIVGLIGGAIGASVRILIDNKKIENEKKSLRQQMITYNIAPMRQAWINDVRSKISLFLSNSVSIQDHDEHRNALKKKYSNEEFHKLEEEFFRKLEKNDELYISLKLLLPYENEKNKEKLAVEAMAYLDLVYDTLGVLNPTNKQIIDGNKKIKICTEKFKFLLKDEWNKTKSLSEID